MKIINYDRVFKLMILILFTYFLALLTFLNNNLERLSSVKSIGKYQSAGDYWVLDTETGNMYNKYLQAYATMKSEGQLDTTESK